MLTLDILQLAKATKTEVALLSSDKKNAVLLAMAQALEDNADYIIQENAIDVESSRGVISDVMLDRLMLNANRIRGMADGIRNVVALPDPIGKIISEKTTADNLHINKISVPMGVIAIIFESRPNVTSDAAALCLKSGNVCVLRGGKEAYRSNQAIVAALRQGLKNEGVSESAINLVTDTSRESAMALMKANGFIDLLIPRGGYGLIKACVENATVPIIETGTGICTIYVDAKADQNKALDIIENAKTQRPSVCNAAECCLVNESIANEFLPKLKTRLVDERKTNPVELRLSKEALDVISGVAVSDNDFDTEFLDYILAVKIVKDVKEAVEHIQKHSTAHSESIITEDKDTADYFVKNIDSAAVYVNASTRFTDGGCFGLGCEMGISTQKLHARGPMGLEELTSYKYVIYGNGQIRK